MTNQQIIDRMGLPAVVDQVAEESTELTHSLQKYVRCLRRKSPTPTTQDEAWNHVKEEFADLLLMAEIVGLWADLPGIANMMDAKRQRLVQRLQEDCNGGEDDA